MYELDHALRVMSGGGGSGLLHWISELDPVENAGPSHNLATLVFDSFGRLSKEQIAEVIWKDDHSGARPIHWAAQSGALHLLKMFLHNDTKQYIKYLPIPGVEKTDDDVMQDETSFIDPVNCVDDKNESPLFYSILLGKYECVDYLISQGADVNIVSKESGFSPLHLATVNHHPQIVGLLIDNVREFIE